MKPGPWILAFALASLLAVPSPILLGQESATPPAAEPTPAPPTDTYQTVYGDIEFERKGEVGLIPPAVFPHWFHRMRFRCYVCHPAVFQMKKGTNDVTMQTIREGRFCGTCHTGKLAWQITLDSCQKCHKGAVRQPVAEKKP